MIIDKRKLLVIHPALAPYRIDFLNSLNDYFDAKFYFVNKNLMNQKFDQDELKKQINFNKCNYLTKGFNYRGRSFRVGFISIIKKEKPDLILSTEFNFISLYLVLASRYFFKKTKIYTITEDNLQMVKDMSKVQLLLRKYITSRLDGVIFTNKPIAEWYKKNIDTSIKPLILPTIRKENKFLNSLSKSGEIAQRFKHKYNLKNKKILLYVGRFTEVKNLERLIIGYKKASKNKNESVLILVGSGKLENKLKELVSELKIQNQILFPGRFEGLELLAWYKISDSFILPSTFEPFGAVINEALLSGCFTAVSEIAGAASLIQENKNGVKFNPFDQLEITNAIHKLLNRDTSNSHESLMLINYNDTFESVASKMH